MLNVQILCKETIKPSSPTPENHRQVKLSLLDQLVPDVYIPLVLYYSNSEAAGKFGQLKKSLSEVLTRFYPLAGRIRCDASSYLHIECNDQGAEFYEARASGKLSEFLQSKSIKESNILLPLVVSRDVPLFIQFNMFDCGGLAIGIMLSHKIGDGSSLTMFLTSWAEATVGNVDKVVYPVFNSASAFPPRSMKPQMQAGSILDEKVVNRRLIFDGSKITMLREKVHTLAGLFPTRVEAVSSLIWRCSMRARGEAEVHKKPMGMHAVNIRGRMDPPLPENSFGNLVICPTVTGDRVIGDCDEVGYLEGRLRDAFREIKGDLIKQMVEDKFEMLLRESSENVVGRKWKESAFDFCTFSSWCGFPLYETDFGWGKPEWLSLIAHSVKNVVMMLPTRNGEGMEVWVSMVEEEMAKFELDPELLAFVSSCN